MSDVSMEVQAQIAVGLLRDARPRPTGR